MSTRIVEFDTWRPGYAGSSVYIYLASTTTLAPVFLDEALTIPAANPQTLLSLDFDDLTYGKFANPLYVEASYQLQINSPDTTGIIRPPLISLEGSDASLAEVLPAGAVTISTLEDLFARVVDVRDYGLFIAVGQSGASASTNNATLVLALGVAAAFGGGFVKIPPGTYQVTNFTVPQGVVLLGEARDASVLQSEFAGAVATIGGTQAGFARITLDGISLVSGSIGVYAANKDQIVFVDAEVKRFETGIWRKGGQLCNWRNLFISNCVSGYKCHGDTAVTSGGATRFNRWKGGMVDTCTGVGIELKYVDSACEHNSIGAVIFDSNTGTAVNLVGAKNTKLIQCQWVGNTTNLALSDATGSATIATDGLEVLGGEIDAGALTFSGGYTRVAFRTVILVLIEVTINAPGQNIVVEDCEISSPTISGVPTCWLYSQKQDNGQSFSTTTDNAAHKAWGITLKSGQQIFLVGTVIGRQRNGINTGFYYICVSAGRPGAALAYDAQTANFTVGLVLTGATSKATARITADADGGATGTLTLQDIVGTFVDNEIITDSATGSATANGAIVESNAALVGTVAAIRAAQETNANWAATFAANGPQIELQVTGDTGQTVEWTANVLVTEEQGTPIAVPVVQHYSTLACGNLGGSFSVGGTVIGGSSGARGTVVSFTGTILFTLTNVSGVFIPGELVTMPAIDGVATVATFTP